MKYKKNDLDGPCKNIGIEAGNYIEIKENEAVIKIKKKWPLVDQIISSGIRNFVNQHNKTT